MTTIAEIVACTEQIITDQYEGEAVDWSAVWESVEDRLDADLTKNDRNAVLTILAA